MADTAVTINDDRVTPLSNQEAAATGFTHKFKVLYSDIAYGAGATDTVTMTLGATPTKWYVERAMVNISTAFAGTTAMTIIVGQTGDTDAFITSQSILTAGVLGSAGFPVATAANSTGTASVGLRAVFTNATGGSPSALSAGALSIYLRMLDAEKLP